MKTIILDPAHGIETQGKRSPDGVHREYLWSRNRLERISKGLEANGVNVVWSHIGDNEPGLSVRRQRMNIVSAPAFVFSLHNNAAGKSGWNNARGAEIYTSIGKTESDALATKIYEKFKKDIPEVVWRTDYFRDGDPDKEANFTVLMSKHPSVLLEWLFMDNKEDLSLLTDDNMNDRLERSLIEVLTDIADINVKVLAYKVDNLQRVNIKFKKDLKLKINK